MTERRTRDEDGHHSLETAQITLGYATALSRSVIFTEGPDEGGSDVGARLVLSPLFR